MTSMGAPQSGVARIIGPGRAGVQGYVGVLEGFSTRGSLMGAGRSLLHFLKSVLGVENPEIPGRRSAYSRQHWRAQDYQGLRNGYSSSS